MCPRGVTGQPAATSLDKCLISNDNVLILGDLNCDLACKEKGRSLIDFMEVSSLENLISLPTCFKKDCVPSLVDRILTNSKNLTFKNQVTFGRQLKRSRQHWDGSIFRS